MRVLALTWLYPPHSRIGAWLTTHEFLAELVRRGHDVTVVQEGLSVRGGTRASYELDGVQVVAGLDRVDELAANADVVVSHVSASRRAADIAAAAGIPSVKMAHGGTVTHDMLDGADLVVWNARSFRDQIGWDGPQIVCHPPVWSEQHRTTPGDAVTLVNLSLDKGVKTMWRCAEHLPNVRFLGVKGHTCEQIEPRAPNVTVWSSQTDMRRVWSHTAVLLVPSAHETWGRVAVEAMASGIPVIAHPTPGLVEALGVAGTFVDRDDIDGWCEAIRHLSGAGREAAAVAALARSAELHPEPDLNRFAGAVESLARAAS